MKFDRFDFGIFKDAIYIIPTVRVGRQMELYYKNFNIQFHFAVFHFRWR